MKTRLVKFSIIIIIFLLLISIAFFLGQLSTLDFKNADWNNLVPNIVSGLLGPLAAGFAIWYLGIHDTDQRLKQDAIRDLMTYRGDYSAPEFTRSLNKVAIIFHDDNEIREEIRRLYDVINNPSSRQETTTRTIVGLIYKLCHKNGFGGLSEYDIDQSFVKPSQTPSASQSPSARGHTDSVSQISENPIPTIVPLVQSRKRKSKSKKQTKKTSA